MKKLKSIWDGIRRIKIWKYLVVTVFAVVLIGFVDENSVWHHFQNKERIDELQQEIKKYTVEHQHNKNRLKMLDSNPKSMEKIARERYFMKADGEDIFVLSDDQEKQVPDETVE